MNKHILLSLVLTLIVGRASASGTRHHQTRIDGAFGFSGLYQPVILNMDFDMDEEPNTAGERIITNFKFTLDLLPGGGVANTPYTMKSGGVGETYAYATRNKDGYDFTLEIPTFVGVEAVGSGLQWCVRRTDRGTLYGSYARLIIWPRCNADLSSCTLGVLGGVSSSSNIPEYRIEASNRFSMAAQN
ncbi:MAG: hypothetical protein Q7J64_02800 [Elusimicrobiota bacterium]|nr:hypothetical protein [Elusimicrobiota bacterium]